MSYQDVLTKHFGGDPQAYANEIQRKSQSGQTFTDQASADAFKQANPQYFQPQQPNNQPGTTFRPTNTNTNQNTQNMFPYEQTLQQIMNSMPQQPQMTEAERLAQAQRYASLQVDPQVQALTRSLQQAMADAQNQQGSIEAAFAGVPQALERQAQQQYRYNTESAIARGGGRSGVVDYSNRQTQQQMNELLERSEAQKAAQLAAIANQLGLTQRQAAEMQQQLEAQRGTLAQQHLAGLNDQSYQYGQQSWQNQLAAAQQLAAMAQDWNTTQHGMSMDIHDRTMLTPLQQHQLNIGYADATGAIPNQMINQFGGFTQPTTQPAQTKDPLAQFGGETAYVASQRQRYQQAKRENNTDLMRRLEADAQRLGYTL